jgi:hypothetical protein
MTAKTRRRRTPSHAPAQPAQQGHAPAHQAPAQSNWHWRTFPVYFAFALGGFLGLEMGIVVAAPDMPGPAQAVVLGFWAILLGFGISRITHKWMTSRGWNRRAARKT